MEEIVNPSFADFFEPEKKHFALALDAVQKRTEGLDALEPTPDDVLWAMVALRDRLQLLKRFSYPQCLLLSPLEEPPGFEQ